ncbi:hypothetical protein RJT34_01966 [Clitoria ternatea]|uniref:Uncharacterized protein n=1 Tax=Clitoria ternatea TaxID=43366 RepID=A0AAN9JC55_CLITE
MSVKNRCNIPRSVIRQIANRAPDAAITWASRPNSTTIRSLIIKVPKLFYQVECTGKQLHANGQKLLPQFALQPTRSCK